MFRWVSNPMASRSPQMVRGVCRKLRLEHGLGYGNAQQ